MRDASPTILCTGDVHLGRHPSRIPEAEDGPSFSSKAVWQSSVREAIERDVDAVVVTGDVVDRENRYFEAYGAFEAGVTRLDEAGIPTVVVAGNHDFDVLPRMVSDVDSDAVTLLGEKGTWERTTIRRDGSPLLEFHGWSFPNEHVLNCPTDEYDLDRETDAPVVGVLHADLDSPGSQYAPVTTSDLRDTPCDAWLLGHIHEPCVHEDGHPFVAYPGTPQALDPGERGAHGPWLLTVDASGGISAEQVPLASVRYDRIDVDVSGLDDPKAVTPLVGDRVTEHVRSGVDTSSLELLLARVRLIGRTTAHGALVDERESIERQLALKAGSLPVRVETLDVETRPAVDLEALAAGDSPTAYLANLLLALDGGEVDDEHERLIEDALAAMNDVHGASAYDGLRREGALERPDEDDARETLEHQATLLLETLLEQKEGRA